MNAPPRKRNAERTRRLVLDAAERIFERDGWRETTLAAVGAEAGVSRGTPAYFFGSKAGLHAAMGARLVDAARAAADGEGAGEPRDRIAALLDSQLELVAARPAFARLVLEHWGRGPVSHTPGAGEGRDALLGLERDLIERIVRLVDAIPGRVPDPEPGAAAAALLAMAWIAGLPGVIGGSVARAPATLTDRSALLRLTVYRMFVDGDFPAVEQPVGLDGSALRQPSGDTGLSVSKERKWRLPGVG